MTTVDFTDTIAKARAALKELPPHLELIFALVLDMMEILLGRSIKKTSRNSSLAPSQDPNRPKEEKPTSARKPGGQKGRVFKTLEPVSDPDRVIEIDVLPEQLREGSWEKAGDRARQVVDLEVRRVITEYRAVIMQNASGKTVTAAFPEGVSRPIQYGASVKAHAVYMSVFQLLPYERLSAYFQDQLGIPLSPGTLCNFNQEAASNLAGFKVLAQEALKSSPCLNADETGINIGGKGRWLHSASTAAWALFYPHEARGREGMDAGGVLPAYKGVLVHDHWKSYYGYTDCRHAMCGAHLLRDLTFVEETFGLTWAKSMKELLIQINKKVSGRPEGKLTSHEALEYTEKYRALLKSHEWESPPPPEKEADPKTGKKKKGPVAKSKHRNLWERFVTYEAEVLRFMEEADVPFTNNRAENDIRMTKVQQKISGCFRSLEGAETFCLIRSYLLTCQKQDVDPSEALSTLFSGQLPEKLTRQAPA